MDGKKTPLYEEHVKAGGRVVDYAGWMLPVEYEGLTKEHQSVRERAGIFDVSHMGEILIEGKDALGFVERVFSNEVGKASPGQIVYGFLLYDNGYVVDDLLIYRLAEDRFLLVTNASNHEKDVKWLKDQLVEEDLTLKDVADSIGQVAIQGPRAQEVLQKVTDLDLEEIKGFRFKEDVGVAGVNCLVSRTGYTGEDGFEIYCAWDETPKVWRALLEAGEGVLSPTGLGCRDTLRFEAGLPLYGQEISDEINPLEAGLGFFVKLKKEPGFIGQEALAEAKEKGLARKLIGIELLGRGMLRSHYPVYVNGKEVGYVTTGYLSPTLGKNIGNALVEAEVAEVGLDATVGIRKKMVEAKFIDKKFLQGGK